MKRILIKLLYIISQLLSTLSITQHLLSQTAIRQVTVSLLNAERQNDTADVINAQNSIYFNSEFSIKDKEQTDNHVFIKNEMNLVINSLLINSTSDFKFICDIKK